MTFEQMAEELGTSVAWVQAEFERLGVPARRRGMTRHHRNELDIEEVIQLYVHEGLSAKEVGRRLDVSAPIVLRALHQEGIAVRRPGARRSSADLSDEVEVLAGLYGDDVLSKVLARHQLEKRWEVGPVTKRFPKPIPLTKALLKDLYLKAGLSADQIELVTGQPRLRVRSMLKDFGVVLRLPGAPAPITLRIWQAAATK
jgi:transposase